MGVPAPHRGSSLDSVKVLTRGLRAPTAVGFSGVTTTLPSPVVNADTPLGNVEGPVPTLSPVAGARRPWSRTSRSFATDDSIFELPLLEGSWTRPVEEATIGDKVWVLSLSIPMCCVGVVDLLLIAASLSLPTPLIHFIHSPIHSCHSFTHSCHSFIMCPHHVQMPLLCMLAFGHGVGMSPASVQRCRYADILAFGHAGMWAFGHACMFAFGHAGMAACGRAEM